MTGWPSTLGGLFRSLPLGNLPREDAETLLRRAGVDRADADRINQLARGHPLSLRLAASALAERPDVSLEAVTVQAIVEELTELYLDVLDPMTRQALDAASVVRRPTLSLLAAMLPDAAPQDAFDRLRRLPFVELSDDGLVLHDTVREAVAALLRSSDPDRSRRYRAAAWRRLREEVARGLEPRDVALHGRPALHPPEPDRPRGVLPDHRAPLFRRGRAGRTTARPSPRSSRATSRRRRSRSSTRGGGWRPMLSASCATGSGAVAGLPHPVRDRST